ncbi:MAG: YceD family protein [Chlamydiota bacterium]
MDDTFIIYVDRLKGGQVEKIAEKCPPAFIDLQDDELFFPADVVVKGQAYLAEQQLVIDIKAATTVRLPCRMCNEPVELDLEVGGIYIVQDLAHIGSGKYDFSQDLREALLLEVPSFVECHEGFCPRRQENEKYIRTEEGQSSEYRPFADL